MQCVRCGVSHTCASLLLQLTTFLRLLRAQLLLTRFRRHAMLQGLLRYFFLDVYCRLYISFTVAFVGHNLHAAACPSGLCPSPCLCTRPPSCVT